MPSSQVGCGSANSASAWATKARCAVGHDTPWLSATSLTERAASPIAAPIAVRNRTVVRDRADDAIMLRPHMVTFDAYQVDGQHVLDMLIHTRNLGTFCLPTSTLMAESLARSLTSFCDQVAEATI
jgi:hypothetical protein